MNKMKCKDSFFIQHPLKCWVDSKEESARQASDIWPGAAE